MLIIHLKKSVVTTLNESRGMYFSLYVLFVGTFVHVCHIFMTLIVKKQFIINSKISKHWLTIKVYEILIH